MKKFMLLVSTVVLLFATSCLDGKNTGGSSSSAEYYGTLTVTDTESGEVTYFDEESQVIVTIPNSYETKFDIVFKGVKFEQYMNVFAIPPTELAANGALYQNYGYPTPKK